MPRIERHDVVKWTKEREFTHPDETVLWLVLLGSVNRVVDESETGALATSEDSLHAEDGGGLGGGLMKQKTRIRYKR